MYATYTSTVSTRQDERLGWSYRSSFFVRRSGSLSIPKSPPRSAVSLRSFNTRTTLLCHIGFLLHIEKTSSDITPIEASTTGIGGRGIATPNSQKTTSVIDAVFFRQHPWPVSGPRSVSGWLRTSARLEDQPEYTNLKCTPINRSIMFVVTTLYPNQSVASYVGDIGAPPH